MLFNSHPHKEDDCSMTALELQNAIFNSHPLEEDDLF